MSNPVSSSVSVILAVCGTEPPSLVQVTVGLGAPLMGIGMLSGSPTRNRISLRGPRRSRSRFLSSLGASEMGDQLFLHLHFYIRRSSYVGVKNWQPNFR